MQLRRKPAIGWLGAPVCCCPSVSLARGDVFEESVWDVQRLVLDQYDVKGIDVGLLPLLHLAETDSRQRYSDFRPC